MFLIQINAPGYYAHESYIADAAAPKPKQNRRASPREKWIAQRRALEKAGGTTTEDKQHAWVFHTQKAARMQAQIAAETLACRPDRMTIIPA